MTTNPLRSRIPVWVTVVLVAVALTTAVVVIATSSTLPDDAAAGRGPVRENVLIIGDSLTLAGESALSFNLRSLGYDATIDAQNGRRIAQAVPLLNRARSTGAMPRMVVIALGTNDHSTSAFRLKRDIDRVLSTIGRGHDVVWVNAYLDTEKAPQYRGYEKVNRLVARAAATNRHVVVADWFGYATRELPAGVLRIDDDGVHYGSSSTIQRAAFIAQALPPCEACSPLFRPSPSATPDPSASP